MISVDNSEAVVEWLNSVKTEGTKIQYAIKWQMWIEYCEAHGLLTNGDAQLEDMKRRRLLQDNTEKYFYDNEVPKFFI